MLQDDNLYKIYETYLLQVRSNWVDFLDCATTVYKHKFSSQVMIYGQYPNATYVANEVQWSKIGRYVKFNPIAIASIVHNNTTAVKSKLYDISQTYGADFTLGDNFNLDENLQARLADKLSNKYNLSTNMALSEIVGIFSKNKTNNTVDKFISSSVEYIVNRKLKILDVKDFSDVFKLDLNHMTRVGSYINTHAFKLLQEFESLIIEMRRNEDEHRQNNRQYTRQLPIGEVRTYNGEAPTGNERGEILGPVDAPNINDTFAQERGRIGGAETITARATRGEESTSEVGQHLSSSKTLRTTRYAGRGDDTRGTVQTNLGYSPKQRFKDNINAIKLVRELADNDICNDEQREILEKYVGFGGLANVFDDTAKGWEGEYKELLSLLSHAEYEMAKASTLTAFYTEPYIVSAIHKGIVNLGINGNAKILEPSMGIGNFFKTMPSELANATLYGVEIDSITGQIATKLYPNANIQIKGYQDTNYPDNFFDLSIGNVPFGEFKLSDNKHSLLIHDFFFAKTLDKIKPNGIIAFITSKGTLDKANPTFRKYLSTRAEFIGAVRLPDTAFKNNANTRVTTDIIFLRKREKEIITQANFIDTSLTDDGVLVNQYYLDNPQNMLGKMVNESSRFGTSTALKAYDGMDLELNLNSAIEKFTKNQTIKIKKQEIIETDISVLPADPNVRNFTYTIVNDNVYFRENDSMTLTAEKGTIVDRIKELHKIRNIVREIILLQSSVYDDTELKVLQDKLNVSYDAYVTKYGYINDKMNKKAFSSDNDYPLLLSIEDVASNGEVTKSKLFTKATISHAVKFTPRTYDDLIILSMNNKGRIDLEFMAEQFSVDTTDVIDNLRGKIYFNPQANIWETSDKYLSGNVKEKLDYAIHYNEIEYPRFLENIEALKLVQPKALTIDEIDIRLGSNFIDIKYYKEFMYELSQTPFYLKERDWQDKSKIILTYNEFLSEYTIYNKNMCQNIQTTSAYGTERKPFFFIMEDSLNLKDVKVYDVKIVNDKEKQVLNIKETSLARQKQEIIRNQFKNWLLADINRANDIVKTYNDRFNVFRPQTFNGSKLNFDSMSNEIELRNHQKDSVARIIYSGNNVLLGHVVGAGKTYTMAAAAITLKRIGIAKKSLFVVPNHLTEQWGADFLKLYPSANILVAKKKDFEPINRKRFIGRICTGEYDAVIIGHSQFEKISMSKEYVQASMNSQIVEVTSAIENRKKEQGMHYSIKQLQIQKAKLETKLKELNTKSKDNVVDFEQLGVDYLFVDEAHYYKNCFVHTKLSNVAGVSTISSQKSFDMLLKTKYITEKNGGKGVVFATGTPISNSMTELYVMQRYLQPDTLKKAKISYFDEWASNFSETQTIMELKPEGTGYRLRTRFCKFHNLPEIINMFKEVADIKIADDLNLEIPKIFSNRPIIEVLKASEYVKQYIDNLAVRAEAIRDGKVQPYEDNMLKITSEGKAVAIDPRILDPNAPVDNNSKIYRCCDNVFKLYDKTRAERSLQLVFLDFGMSMYTIIQDELIQRGVNPPEIAFIHSADTDEKKVTLFAKCRSGDIRVLIGSTSKMGAGTNIQERLIANHHLDCPWRPSDIEQRDGRILRQGNIFSQVYIYRYVTEQTFDAYLWQIQENKQKFITQIMTNKSAVRSCDDIDDAVLSCAEVKTLATGDPRIKEKMQLDNDIYILQIEKSAYFKEHTKLQNMLIDIPNKIAKIEQDILNINQDIVTIKANICSEFYINIDGKIFVERKLAGEYLNKAIETNSDSITGNYCGIAFKAVKVDCFGDKQLQIVGQYHHTVLLGLSDVGNITRIENDLTNLPIVQDTLEKRAISLNNELQRAVDLLDKPFAKEVELFEKLQKQAMLNSELEFDIKENGNCYEEENEKESEMVYER